MSVVKAQGLLIAFGLSVGLHAIGLGFVKILPYEPNLFPTAAVSIKLIKSEQKLVVDSAPSINAEPRKSGTNAQVGAATYPSADQKSEVGRNDAKPEENYSESIFTKSTHYFESSEIDFRSEPLSEWVLRTDSISTNEKIAIQLTVFIGQDGKLDKFEILNSTLSPPETEWLVKDLILTTFKPALKDGRTVPSQQNVEIFLDSSPPIFRIPNLLTDFFPKNK